MDAFAVSRCGWLVVITETVPAIPVAPLTDQSAVATVVSRSVCTDRRFRTAWSKARLSAAVAATRPARIGTASGPLLPDEIEFFATEGTRHELPSGVVLAEHGQSVRNVHLVEHGAVAVLGGIEGRRPILAFTMPDELCCAVPALLRQPPPWDTVTITDSSVITISTDQFIPAVLDRWADRWSTRALSWLAEIGARVADLDGVDLTGHVAALLLRHRGEASVHLRCRTLADLLDVDDDTILRVLAELRRFGAVRLDRGHVTIAGLDRLQTTVAAARGSSRPERVEG